MDIKLKYAITGMLSQFSGGDITCKAKDDRTMVVTMDNRFQAQAFFIMLREDLAKKGIPGKVYRVGRYQVYITQP